MRKFKSSCGDVQTLRYKHVTARPDGYHIQCPYKKCGEITSLSFAGMGMLVECDGCKRTLRITKRER